MDVYYLILLVKSPPFIWLLSELLFLCTLAEGTDKKAVTVLSLLDNEGGWIQQSLVFKEMAIFTR